MKISVVIPCIAEHSKFLPQLIESYFACSVKPDEIIIAGDCALPKTYQNVILIKSKFRELAGTNRNIGTDASSGDIIVYQDADDLIHPQRLEIVRYIFSRYPELVHANHLFMGANDGFELYNDFEKIKILKQSDYENWIDPSIPYGSQFGNISAGVPIIRSQVKRLVQWPASEFEDKDYCNAIAQKFGKSCIIAAEIYKYQKIGTVK